MAAAGPKRVVTFAATASNVVALTKLLVTPPASSQSRRCRVCGEVAHNITGTRCKMHVAYVTSLIEAQKVQARHVSFTQRTRQAQRARLAYNVTKTGQPVCESQADDEEDTRTLLCTRSRVPEL
jgi:hypothetical protein